VSRRLHRGKLRLTKASGGHRRQRLVKADEIRSAEKLVEIIDQHDVLARTYNITRRDYKRL
jgi:hypothetical protein